MSRLRVDSSFASQFTRPLSVASLPVSRVASSSTEELRSILASLKPPFSQAAVDDALEYLSNNSQSFLVAEERGEEKTPEDQLRNAVVSEVAVGLYGRALDEYLNQAIEIEAEADWWANIERSELNVVWFLIQTLPERLTRVFKTIAAATRAHGLPLQVSSFSPSSLLRLFPSTSAQPSALTRAFFPHLEDEPSMVSVVWTRPSLRTPRLLHSIWSAIFLPVHLTREECRLKRRQLRSVLDRRATTLGMLADLRRKESSQNLPMDLLVQLGGDPENEPTSSLECIQVVSSVLFPKAVREHAETIGALRRPSRLALLWPKLLLFPPLALYAAKVLYDSRASLFELARDAKATLEGFVRNSLVEPLKDVIKTVRTGGEDGVIVRPEGVAADVQSLERMTLSLARDQLNYNAAQLDALSKQIRVGDLTPVLQLYEEDIKHPVKSALTGALLRSMFIQVQKAKVDIGQALSGIDKLLKSQELTFAFVGLAPALVIVTLAGRYVSRLWRGAVFTQGRFARGKRRTAAWDAMRRIERILVSEPRTGEMGTEELSNRASGMLLISVTRLRTYAETSLPTSSRLREGFLEDVADLEDPEMPRQEKLRVVERMWRCWGGVLGWGHVAAEGIFGV
ncbi:hypothetical protein MKEN_01258900 [Mycena kentingensis (nom. inval.)]|nr:hypothetical protein MKEN_01258900 [Mycena kentingensis (nom. inval.)]